MKQLAVVISINAAWNIFNFRRGLIAALRSEGYSVVALAPPDGYSHRLVDLGVEFRPIEIDKQGASPLRDLMLLGRYYRALRAIRPAIFLGYTAKPNIYGSLAARLLGIPVINNVSGLGTAFIRRGVLTHVVSSLYRLAFSQSATIFFQNDEDRALFQRKGIVGETNTRLLPGSGINLAEFIPPLRKREADGEFRFLMVARLLWDKGVQEYVDAARMVRRTCPNARFQLLGFLDVANRTAVPRSDVEAWVAEGVIDYLGAADDVRPAIAAADCVVLPSYREGLPRTLLEASAMAKPLIAADVPGCRHVVRAGENGFLCAPRDAASLAEAMMKMLELPEEKQDALGRRARVRAEAEYDERIVTDAYLEAIREAVACA